MLKMKELEIHHPEIHFNFDTLVLQFRLQAFDLNILVPAPVQSLFISVQQSDNFSKDIVLFNNKSYIKFTTAQIEEPDIQNTENSNLNC